MDQSAAPQTLSRSLSPRHVTMISMGGMIGAGVFVGSSAAIAAVGPAIVLSYLIAGVLILLVMRMLAEMATALPNVRTFTEFARAGLGSGRGLRGRLAVLVLLDHHGGGRGDRRCQPAAHMDRAAHLAAGRGD
jgi:L-asparagine transporter-like permease